MHQPELKTKRLILRSFRANDAERVCELAGDFELAKTTFAIPHPYLLKDAVEWISTHAEARNEGSRLVFAITKSEDATLIGTTSLFGLNADRGTLGYWVGKPFWGCGYCTEAVGAVINFAFNELNLNRIIAGHFAKNRASGRVLEKNGMDLFEKAIGKGRNAEDIDLLWYEIFNRA